MSIIEHGAIGGFSGKTGPVVGARVRGQDTMRAKPRKSTKPKTLKQLVQQARFKVITSFITKAQGIFKIGYQENTGKLTPYNKAFQYHDEHAVMGAYPDFKIDYAKVKWTDENRYLWLQMMMEEVVTPLPLYKVKIDWTNIQAGDVDKTNGTDVAKFLFYSPTRDMYILAPDVTRSTETVTATLPRLFAESDIHGWVFFVSADGQELSATTYLGLIKLQA
ncbi:hypothetical protein PBAL39_20124 [Pedobacter sp. BAL39]|uniref:DUF6266 family protein n=1 Tax=Pedobacter sp. BAL39 TaxID=391596 RepID=UPI0001559846|nr:DUF6266 family protein [Pedobacter sp. BAL39]EDM36226.1 hypothetical protein PBAL39_20124 [Pedobacter sp. BAL39]